MKCNTPSPDPISVARRIGDCIAPFSLYYVGLYYVYKTFDFKLLYGHSRSQQFLKQPHV
jgi:hypothetical protein